MPHRRVPPAVVGDAIAAYYDGLSYRDIQRRVETNHGFTPSTATLYEWVRDYTIKATKLTDDFKANTGGTWVADEMVVKIDGKNVWLWNVMDAKTRYLLATHLSETRTIKDAETVFRSAKRRATHPPKRIITDGLAAYSDGIERTFGAETRHEVSLGIRSHELNNNLAERLNGTIRERTKVMRGMETKRTAELVMDGFRLHYNHMKPHHGLRGRVPARAAGLRLVFKNWVEVASLQDTTIQPKAALKSAAFKSRPIRSNVFVRSRGRL
jgi:transposase-like protein